MKNNSLISLNILARFTFPSCLSYTFPPTSLYDLGLQIRSINCNRLLCLLRFFSSVALFHSVSSSNLIKKVLGCLSCRFPRKLFPDVNDGISTVMFALSLCPLFFLCIDRSRSTVKFRFHFCCCCCFVSQDCFIDGTSTSLRRYTLSDISLLSILAGIDNYA